MNVIVPFDPDDPKSRLSDCLTIAERRAFARTMLDDVLWAVRESDNTPVILTTSPLGTGAREIIDEQPLNDAVNKILKSASLPIAILMADLPLVTPPDLRCFFKQPGDIVLAPGIGGGTNAVVVRKSGFRVDYHQASFREHTAISHELGATITDTASWRIAIDIDEWDDLVEILLHSDGSAHDWLLEHGFSIVVSDGRATVDRQH